MNEEENWKRLKPVPGNFRFFPRKDNGTKGKYEGNTKRRMVKGRREQRGGENVSQRREANVEAGRKQKVDGGGAGEGSFGVGR